MDALSATLSIVAGALAVIASAIPLYIAYKERKERKKPVEENHD